MFLFVTHSAEAVWERLSLGVGNALERPWITVLMAVPTVYAQLIEAYEQMEREGDVVGEPAQNDPFFAPFIVLNDLSTKTGSGQT